jgi:hypothetical protein
MSKKDELKAGLKRLRDALTSRAGEFNSGSVGARWTGAGLRSTGIGPSRKRNAWRDLAEEPPGAAGVVTTLEAAVTAVTGATPSTAAAALSKAEDALDRLERLLGL